MQVVFHISYPGSRPGQHSSADLQQGLHCGLQQGEALQRLLAARSEQYLQWRTSYPYPQVSPLL